MNSPDPISAVQRSIEACNPGDVQAMAALCANPISVLEGMAHMFGMDPWGTQNWYKGDRRSVMRFTTPVERFSMSLSVGISLARG
jgi:hypothetical protein